MKERSPGAPTLYAGYTNEILGYLPTANEYQFGGYEAGYGYKSVGLPSLFDPSVEQILVETGVRLAERLFPEAEPWDDGGRLDRARRGAVPAARARRSCSTLATPYRGRGQPLSGIGDRRRSRAGAARLSLEPPLDLPLVGFVRADARRDRVRRFGLETSAIALEQDGARVVLCGVDIVGIGEPEITGLLDASRARPAPTRPGSCSTGTTRTSP